MKPVDHQSTAVSFSAGKSVGWRRWVSVLVFAVVLGVGGWSYYQHRRASTLATAQETLISIADLKVTALERWMSERHGDAEVMRNSLMARSVLLNPNNAETRDLAAERFRVWLRVYDYAAVLVANSNGVVQMTEPADFPLIPAEVTNRIYRTLTSPLPVQADLHRDQSGKIHLWLSGQVFTQLQTNGPPDGAFISVVDPYRFLYPFVNKWPTPNKSGETLLVRREGDYAVYQNPLAHVTNAPMTFRVPIAAPTQLLCVKLMRGDPDAAEGKVVETLDYRGVTVLAVARRVPQTPWVLVAKMDADEVFAPLRREAFQIVVIFALLLLIIGLGIVSLSRQQKLAFARANEARFRMLIEEAPTAISISRGNNTLYVNTKYLEMYGFKSMEEVVGRPVTDLWAPEFRPLIAQRIRQRARGEPAPNEYEGVGQRRDGASFPVHVAVTSVELSDGKASLAFLTDITERKRAEASSSKLAAIVESTDDAIISKTLDGIIVSWNRGAEKLFGYPAQDAVGQSILMVFPPERVQEERDILQRISRGETVENFETERLAKDGKRLKISVTISPIRNAEGVITGASKIARDITERKRVEESLKLFRHLIDHANDAIEVVDPQTGRFLDVNEKAGQIHGCTREQYLALTIPEIDPEFAAAGEGAWQAHLENLQRQGFLVFESSHRRKDGSVFPVEINASYVRLERDYILAVVRDITERKRTETQIRQLNRVYAVLSGINTLIVRERNPQKLLEGACQIAVDKGQFRMAWAGLLEDSTGKIRPTASAGVVENYLDMVNIDLSDPLRSAGPSGRAFLAGKHHYCNDIENDPAMLPWRADALRLGYHSSGAFPLKVAGKVIGMFSLYASEKGFFDSQELKLLDELAGDISFGLEVNQRELERQRVEGLFTMAFERAAIGKALVAPDGRWLKVNHALRQMLGYTEAEFYAKTFQDFTHPEDLARDAMALEQLLRGGQDTLSVEKRYRHQAGHYVWAYLTTSLVRNEVGAPDYFISQVQDISERRHLEEQLRQAQKMEAFGQLAGGVAHDFNNILAAIMMQAEVSLLAEDLPGTIVDEISQIRASAERGANLTGQLLLFSRKKVMQPQSIDLNVLVSTVAKMLRRLIGADVSLQLDLGKKAAKVMADPGMIDQVVLNLVVNARDAMPQGGTIRIAVVEQTLMAADCEMWEGAQPGAYVGIAVTDTGTGIKPEHLARIFEPFFTTKEAGKGTGLGLATVYGIVKQHKGVISVQSQLGTGTCFTVLLPAEAGVTEDSGAITQTSAPKGGAETILLVEDEPLVRSMTKIALERAGYQVMDAPDGVQAAEVWKQHQASIRLLLTDLVMPGGVSGRDLAARLKTDKPELAVVFMSGYSADIAGKELVLKLGENFIQKPCRLEPLMEIIRRSIDGSPDGQGSDYEAAVDNQR